MNGSGSGFQMAHAMYSRRSLRAGAASLGGMVLDGATYNPGIPSGKRPSYMENHIFLWVYKSAIFNRKLFNYQRVNEIAAVGRLAKQAD